MKHLLKFIPLAVIALGLTLILKFAVTKHPTSLAEFPAWMQFGIMLSYAVFIIIVFVVLATIMLTAKPKSDSQKKEQVQTAQVKTVVSQPATPPKKVADGMLTLEEVLKLAEKASWKRNEEKESYGSIIYSGQHGNINLTLFHWTGGSSYRIEVHLGEVLVGDEHESGNGPLDALYLKLVNADYIAESAERDRKEKAERMKSKQSAEEVRREHFGK